MKTNLFDQDNRPIAFGDVIGVGGEGTVYRLRGDEERVAKIYTKAPSQDLTDKIKAMIAAADPKIAQFAAWPNGAIQDQSRRLVGFTMPKMADCRPVFEAYGPKLRLRNFPEADWRFLIHVAMNTAIVFSTIHEKGQVIADVNHANLLVAKNATVRLIDCDSFQITRQGKTWFCEVGVGTHQPPEMQNLTSFRGVVRTANHDNFGLAVMIFQLLLLAQHPFQGRYQGSGEPPSIEEAIRDCRYAYSSDSRTMMVPPLAAPALTCLSPAIRNLFETAFSATSMTGGRPNGNQWLAGLNELRSQLHRCNANPGHYYYGASCPWCTVEGLVGFAIFPVIVLEIDLDAGTIFRDLEGLSLVFLPALPALNTGLAPSAFTVRLQQELANARKALLDRESARQAQLVWEAHVQKSQAAWEAAVHRATLERDAVRKAVLEWEALTQKRQLDWEQQVHKAQRRRHDAIRYGLIALVLVVASMFASLSWAVAGITLIIAFVFRRSIVERAMGLVPPVQIDRPLILPRPHVPAHTTPSRASLPPRPSQGNVSIAPDTSILNSEIDDLVKHAEALATEWEQLKSQWHVDLTEFSTLKRKAESLKRVYDGLAGERDIKLRQMRQDRWRQQMVDHLLSFSIASAKITGIGKAKVSTLIAYQISSAADIHPTYAFAGEIPGFGPVLRHRLVEWHSACSSTFRFDPAKDVSPASVDALNNEIRKRRNEVLKDLAATLSQLRIEHRSLELRKDALLRRATALAPALEQSIVDAQVFRPQDDLRRRVTHSLQQRVQTATQFFAKRP